MLIKMRKRGKIMLYIRYILSHLAQYQYSLVRHTAVGPVNVATLYSVTHLVQRMFVLTLFKEQGIF